MERGRTGATGDVTQADGAERDSVTVEERWSVLATLMSRVPDPAILVSREGRIRAATAPLAGLDPPELSGLRLLDLVPREHRERVEVALGNVLSPGLSHTVEVPILSPAGAHRWYLAHLGPVVVDDRIAAILVLTTDVTASHEEEERLRRSERLMVDAQGVAHMGTWEWDPREPHARWSRHLYEIYGLDPEKHTPSYQDYLERVHPDDRARVMEATERVFRNFEPYSHDERVRRPNGDIRYLHTWAEAVLDDQGKLARLVGVCQDITDRKEAEDKARLAEVRRRRIEELEGVSEWKSRLLSVASHEIKNPLTPIMLQLSALRSGRMGALSEEQSEMITAVLQQTERLQGLLADLQDLAQIEQRRLVVKLEDVPLGPIVARVAESLRSAAEEWGVSLRIDVDPTVVVRVDPRRLDQILFNLLTNALKFTRAGGDVTLRAERLGDEVHLSVHDTGPGLSDAQLAQLFQAFSQVHDEARTREAGTGLGLFIVKHLVEAQAGRVWAESRVGQGSVFHVTLPAAVTSA
jgi:PAS domain S-box-containing protein